MSGGLNFLLPACEEAIIWGLSESVFRERKAKAEKVCWFSDKQEYSDEEEATLSVIPLTSRWEHPIVIHHETCERNIMMGR
jgi:hypothetical protein